MISRKTIQSSQHNICISIDKNNIFTKDLNKYRELFNEYIEQGKIVSSTFEDVNWVIVDKYKNRRKLNFFNTKLSNELKAYILLKCEENIGIHNIGLLLGLLKESIHLSKHFNENSLDNFLQEISELGFNKRSRLSLAVINFLNFINHPRKEKFNSSLKKFIKYSYKNRKLPPYQSVLLFDEIIQDFIYNSSNTEKMKYFPVILWWKLTTVLPLRPIEFCLLSYNCIKKDGERYLITVPRKKQKYEGFCDIDIENTFETNLEIFNLIREYQDNTKERKLGFKYLFTYETYASFNKEARPEVYKRDPSFFLNSSFNVLLRHFYENIVKTRYDTQLLDKIKPGDTRHFAICNMMLQGFNMLTIAKLAGHRRINVQQGYWNHIDYFVQSYVYVLSQNNKFNNQDTLTSFSSIDQFKKSQIYEELSFENLRPVEYGYCTDLKYPFNCTECAHCDYFLFSPKDYDKGITWITEHSDTLDKKITKNISYLRNLFKNIQSKIHFKTGEYSLIDQEEIYSTTTRIKYLAKNKALVDSLIPNHIGDDKNEE
ncbi:hypothetical protein ASG98_00040 [Bacillus sp. Soil531]|nr:hypothetical protein ASG98_00040 [Bacillus sp. Soil531]